MTREDNEVIKQLADILQRMDAANTHASSYYDLLKSTRRLNSVLLAVTRCKYGCTLLEVFKTPAGPAFHQPRYKLSPTRNESESSEEGRAANTEDGDHRWKMRGGMLTAALNFTLNCDHVHTVIEKTDLELGEPGRPTRRVLT